MHNARARHHDIQHTVRMNRIAASACSSRMTTCGLDRNQQDLFPHHARLNLGIVAAMRHNSYRSITQTHNPQLRRGYPNIQSAATAGPENNPRCAVLVGCANGHSPKRGSDASVSLGRREGAPYASEWPHKVGSHPWSLYELDAREDLSPEQKHKILVENPQRLYGLG